MKQTATVKRAGERVKTSFACESQLYELARRTAKVERRSVSNWIENLIARELKRKGVA